MKLLFCVLASLLAVACGQVCLTPGVEITNDQTARLCYREPQRTTVQLSCNWEEYRFELKVTPDQAQRELTVTQTAHLGRANMPLPGAETASGRSACPAPAPGVHQDFNFNFLTSADPQVRMEIVDGQLYYKTNVTIHESYYTDETCKRARFYDTNIVLSCCADPQSTPPKEVTVPLHGHCLEQCTVEPPFYCECEIRPDTPDRYTVTAHSTLPPNAYPPNVDFQLNYARAFPWMANPTSELVDEGTNLPIVAAAALEPLPAHLEVQHSVGQFVGDPTTINMNVFLFHGAKDKRVMMGCRPQYCLINREVSDTLSYLPTCAVSRRK